MNELKLYVVGGNLSYADYLLSPNPHVKFTLTKDIRECHFALFTGGEDINPAVYGENAHTSVYFNQRRDTMENLAYDYLKAHKIPMLGICRGHQLFAARNGAKLYQNVSGHAGGSHMIDCTLDNGATTITLPVPSAHHQMIDENTIKSNWIVWAKSSKVLSKYYDVNPELRKIPNEKTYEIEGLYIPESLCLSIQGHPEWMDEKSATVDFWLQTIKHFLM